MGATQYLANTTRPDILFASNFLGRFTSQPRQKHWLALKDVLRYLKATPDTGISYRKSNDRMECYSDADWANDRTERMSTSGGLVTLAGGAIVNHARKQSPIAQSTAEAEYVAANGVSNSIRWLVSLLQEMSIEEMFPTPRLHIDNQSTISQIKNNCTLKSSKHIELRYHNLRQAYQDGKSTITHISTEAQPADLLTKALPGRE